MVAAVYVVINFFNLLTQMQVREAQRKYADLETRMKEDLMMARIREAENTQFVAELTQKISSLEYKVRCHMITVFLPGFRHFLTGSRGCNGLPNFLEVPEGP